MNATGTHALVPIADPSQVGEARRLAATESTKAGLDATMAGSVAIIINELANNILLHATSGQILLRRSEAAIEILAIDSGPGMDVGRCMTDGYSSRGTAGEGLGAVKRQAAVFDVFSRPGQGTVVLARVGAGDDGPDVCVGAVSVAYPGEPVCGDAWELAETKTGVSVLVVDGLGHGVGAADASHAALRAFEHASGESPEHILARAHERMSGTRGGAVAVARIDVGGGALRYAGIGNISGVLWRRGESRGLMSHNGTVGAQMRQVKELEFPWGPDSVLILHSDGLSSRWKLDDYGGLMQQHPAIIAGLLYRDFRRGRDDATVVVVAATRGLH